MTDEPDLSVPLDEAVPGTTVVMSTAGAIGSIALSLAMKYHDMNMIKDGALYQQYKLEGKNFRELHLDVVFETAMRIEQHLLATNERIAKVVVMALEQGLTEEAEGPEE